MNTISERDSVFLAELQAKIDSFTPSQRTRRRKELDRKYKAGLTLGEATEFIALTENTSIVEASKTLIAKLSAGVLEGRGTQHTRH